MGAGWLILKTEGDLQAWARKTRPALPLWRRSCAIAVVSVWTPIIDPHIAARWFSWPNIAYLAPVPLITAALVVYVWRAFDGRSEHGPFIGSLGLFLMSYLGITDQPVPDDRPASLHARIRRRRRRARRRFCLIGTLFLLPIILIYTAWSYWVFRGKVRADVGIITDFYREWASDAADRLQSRPRVNFGLRQHRRLRAEPFDDRAHKGTDAR